MSSSLPGLDRPLTQQDLEQSRVEYNGLPYDEDQEDIDEHHLGSLRQIIIKFELEKVFGVHLGHRHFELPRGHVLLGTNFGPPACRWVRTVSNSDVNVCNIHGHIYMHTKDGFHPYEYQEGQLPKIDATAFLSAFGNYLIRYQLEGRVGLEVLCPEFKDKDMSEIVMDDGQTSMWETRLLTKLRPGRATGWSFSREQLNCTPGESHAQLDDGSHRKYNEGSAHPKPKTFSELALTLAERQLVKFSDVDAIPSAGQSSVLAG